MFGVTRPLLLSFGLCALLGWTTLHYHGLYVSAEARSDTRVAVQASQQSTATFTDQHKADQKTIQQLQDQLQKMQSDSDHAASIQIRLQAALTDQQKVLHAYEKTHPNTCLSQRVPDALIDSLHTSADRPAKPPGQYR